jgi:hypothetical protein
MSRTTTTRGIRELGEPDAPGRDADLPPSRSRIIDSDCFARKRERLG